MALAGKRSEDAHTRAHDWLLLIIFPVLTPAENIC